jgi:hypothetical protein
VLKTAHEPISGHELERLAQKTIRRILLPIPGMNVEISGRPVRSRCDFEAHLTTAFGPQTLICEAKSRAWPNEIHAIAHRLKSGIREHPSIRSVPVLIAPYFTSQAVEACSELGISWADLVGNCELKIDGAYIKVQGNENPYKRGRGTASLYSPKAARVVHALLLERHRKWTTEELARASGTSLGQVASVKKLLDNNHWIRASYGETVLTEPKKLLNDWSLHYHPNRKTIRFFTLDSPSQLEKRVADSNLDYAFTEFSAAERYAPYTRHQRVAFYVSRWDEDQASFLGLKRGDSAANVTIYETGEALPFVEEPSGIQCVSPVLAYLDLKLVSGRGQDAAEHLLEAAIEPRWQ